jgi:hypothetical protein
MRDNRGGRNALIANALSSLILTAAVFAGGALRLFNLDWDQGYLFHPDERMILMTIGGLNLPWPPNWDVLLSPASPLNPHFFAYGSLPLYLLAGGSRQSLTLASYSWSLCSASVSLTGV